MRWSPTLAAMLVGGLPGAVPMAAGWQTITVTDSIQEALDQAQPGDEVLIPPGVYVETLVIEKDDITIRALEGAILDATGAAVAVRAGALREEVASGAPCLPPQLRSFTLDGLEIRGATESAVQLSAVDSFRIARSVLIGNGETGLDIACSSNGLIDSNEVRDHSGAGISALRTTATVIERNRLVENGIGVRIHGSESCTIRENTLTGNRVAIQSDSSDPGRGQERDETRPVAARSIPTTPEGPSMGVMAAPNRSQIDAKVLEFEQSTDFPEKWYLTLVIQASVSVEGPNFAREGATMKAFTFDPPEAVAAGVTISAEAEFLGDERGGQLQLTDLQVVDPG